MCKNTLAYCYVNSPYTIFVTNTHIHTHTHTMCTHTHAHAHTQTGLVTLAVTLGSYFSHCFHKVYMCMNCTRLCTHTTHTYMHTHTHTHTHTQIQTHTDGACTTCSDFGFLFLTLYSQSMYMCKNTVALLCK